MKSKREGGSRRARTPARTGTKPRAHGVADAAGIAKRFVIPDRAALQRLRRVMKEASARYLHRPDLLGVSIGWKRTGGIHTPELCLRFHVREKVPLRFLPARAALPRKFLGLACDVVRSPPIRPSFAAPAGADGGPAIAPSELRPGVSVGIQGLGAGSLGLLMRDRSGGGPGFLTCAHVVVPNGLTTGAEVFHPAPSDGGLPPALARVLRFHVGLRGDGAFCRAIAQNMSGRNVVRDLEGAELPVAGLRSIEDQAATGRLLVAKVGRTTGFTVGAMSAVYGRRKIETPWGERIMECAEIVPLWLLDPSLPCEELTMQGDSGSVFYDPADGVAFGLTMCGPDGALGSSEEFVLVADLADLAKELGIEAVVPPGGPT